MTSATGADGAEVVVPGLWAVGDVTRRQSPRHGVVPGGHWDGALRGPRALAGHFLGRPAEAPDDDPARRLFTGAQLARVDRVAVTDPGLPLRSA